MATQIINKYTIAEMHNTLQLIKELVYDNYDFKFNNLLEHKEGTEYGACRFELNGLKIEHRVSKITPTKVGQFVTIWKRTMEGITAPFDVSDSFDFIIITSKSENYIGQFVFPKAVLEQHGIISKNTIGGKRGIRVYPPWVMVRNKQATKTQNWQKNYFFTVEKFPYDLNSII